MNNYNFLAALLACLILTTANISHALDIAIGIGNNEYRNTQTAYIDCSLTEVQVRVYDRNGLVQNPSITWSCSANLTRKATNSSLDNLSPVFILDPAKNDGHLNVTMNGTQMMIYVTQKSTPTITVDPNLCTPGQSGTYAATLNFFGPSSADVIWETTGGVTVNGSSYYRVTDNTISSAVVQYNSFGTLSVRGEIPGCNNMQTKKTTKRLGPPQVYLFAVNTQTYNTTPNVCVGSTQAIRADVSENTNTYQWSISSGNAYGVNFSGYGNNAWLTPSTSGYFVAELQLGNNCGVTSNYVSFYAYDCYSYYKVYPNPASSYVTVESSTPDNESEITIYDENQTLVARSLGLKKQNSEHNSVQDGKSILDVKDLKRGVYYLHIKSVEKKDKKPEVVRIVLE